MRTRTAIVFLFVLAFLFLGCSKTSEVKTQNLERYENGWPTFWLSYPSDWVRKPVQQGRGEVFAVDAPMGMPVLRASINLGPPAKLQYFSRTALPALGTMGSNIDIIEDKAVTLKDGREAWETRIDWDPRNGPSLSTLFLVTKKETFWIIVSISAMKGKLTDELTAIPYSLEVYPEKELPVALPDGIDRFFKEFTSAVSEHDIDKVMGFYSDEFKNNINGATKADFEGNLKLVFDTLTSFKMEITKYRPGDDHVFLAGYMFVSGNKVPLLGTYLAQNDEGHWVIIASD